MQILDTNNTRCKYSWSKSPIAVTFCVKSSQSVQSLAKRYIFHSPSNWIETFVGLKKKPINDHSIFFFSRSRIASLFWEYPSFFFDLRASTSLSFHCFFLIIFAPPPLTSARERKSLLTSIYFSVIFHFGWIRERNSEWVPFVAILERKGFHFIFFLGGG